MKNILKTIFSDFIPKLIAVFTTLLIIWMFASFCEVNAKNNLPNPDTTISNANFFKLLTPKQK